MAKVEVYVIGQYGIGRTETIESDENGSYLSALQELVGGSIEYLDVAFEGAPALIVNEDGLTSCSPNCCFWANKHMAEVGYLSQVSREVVEEGSLYTLLFGPIVLMSHELTVDEDGCEDLVPRDITPDETRIALKQLTPDADLYIMMMRGGLE